MFVVHLGQVHGCGETLRNEANLWGKWLSWHGGWRVGNGCGGSGPEVQEGLEGVEGHAVGGIDAADAAEAALDPLGGDEGVDERELVGIGGVEVEEEIGGEGFEFGGVFAGDDVG